MLRQAQDGRLAATQCNSLQLTSMSFAVCCSVLSILSTRWRIIELLAHIVLHHTATLRHTAPHYTTLQHTVYVVLQRAEICCNTMQYAAVCCRVLYQVRVQD
mmetsp:Transcript_62435/g.91491  ORF Transcript_62435/g.91491 Transcript_62435/m.91491 type:complete len:102 (+) Transcript_62435:941-1246(+)